MATKKHIDPKAHMSWILKYVIQTNASDGNQPMPPPSPESLDSGFLGGGSPNMKGLYCACWLAWALLTGSKHFEVHLRRAVNRMLQEREAHGGVEFLSPTHGQLWIAFVALMLWVAERENIGSLRDLCVDWLQQERAYWQLCVAGDDVWTAGGRAVLKGTLAATNPARSEALQVIHTGKSIGRDNQYDVGPELISRLTERTRLEIQEWPKKFDPVLGGCETLRWNDNDFYQSIGVADGTRAKDFVQGAGVLNGERWIDPAGLSDERRAAYEAKGTPARWITALPATLHQPGKTGKGA